MNCAECQTEPLTPGHYCPCCGRQLSLQERRAVEASSPAPRCQSCGGPSAEGDLCTSCTQAFAPVLGSATVAAPSDVTATAGAQKVPTVINVQKAPTVIKTTAAVPPPVVNVPPPVVNVNAIQIEVSRSDTAKAVADMTAKAHLAKAANPAPVPKRPIVAAPPQRRSRTTVWIKAAAVIVVAIGAAEGARRLGLHWPQPAAREEQPVHATPVVASATAERGATPPHTRSEAKTVAENRASGIAPSKAAALPKPTTAAGRRRAVRQEGSSDQHVAPVVAPAPAPETPAPVPTKPRALVAGSPVPPTGRFFERNDVDEPPQIATRVEPQLPANLPARPHNDVVVVRVLVSSTGHPFRVSLLRGSRLGRSSDEAVVAAVTRWTFSPAKKRGESVNCWYNIGVPLGKAN